MAELSVDELCGRIHRHIHHVAITVHRRRKGSDVVPTTLSALKRSVVVGWDRRRLCSTMHNAETKEAASMPALSKAGERLNHWMRSRQQAGGRREEEMPRQAGHDDCRGRSDGIAMVVVWLLYLLCRSAHQQRKRNTSYLSFVVKLFLAYIWMIPSYFFVHYWFFTKILRTHEAYFRTSQNKDCVFFFWPWDFFVSRSKFSALKCWPWCRAAITKPCTTIEVQPIRQLLMHPLCS